MFTPCFSKEEPLHEIAANLGQKGVNAEAVEAIYTTRSIWGYDLLARKVVLDNLESANSPKVIFALLVSNLGVRDELTEFVKKSIEANASRREFIDEIKRLFETRFHKSSSGLRWHPVSSELRSRLKDLCGPNLYKALMNTVGEHDTPPKEISVEGKAEARQAVLLRLKRIVADPENVSQSETQALHHEAITLLEEGGEEFAQRVDRLSTELILKMNKKIQSAESVKDLLRFKNIFLVAGLSKHVIREMGGKKAYSVEAMEGLAVTVIEKFIRGLPRVSPGLKLNPNEDSYKARAFAFEICQFVAKISFSKREGQKTRASAVEFKELSEPFDLFIADFRVQGGDKIARTYLIEQLKEKFTQVGNLITAMGEAGKAKDAKRIAAIRGELKQSSERLKRSFAVIHLAASDIQELRAYVVTVNPVLGKWLDNEIALNSKKRDKVQKKMPQKSGKTALLIRQYHEGKLNIARFFSQMRALNAGDDIELYKAFKADLAGKQYLKKIEGNTITRLIGIHGDAADAGWLRTRWNNAYDPGREAIVVAVENKKYRLVYDYLMHLYLAGVRTKNDYSGKTYVTWRRATARLVMKMAEPKDFGTLIECIAGESDQMALELLGLGLLRICRDQEQGPQLIGNVGVHLKSNSNGKTWFYLTSLLRALVPNIDLELEYSGQQDKKTKIVDTAVAQVTKRLFPDKDK